MIFFVFISFILFFDKILLGDFPVQEFPGQIYQQFPVIHQEGQQHPQIEQEIHITQRPLKRHKFTFQQQTQPLQHQIIFQQPQPQQHQIIVQQPQPQQHQIIVQHPQPQPHQIIVQQPQQHQIIVQHPQPQPHQIIVQQPQPQPQQHQIIVQQPQPQQHQIIVQQPQLQHQIIVRQPQIQQRHVVYPVSPPTQPDHIHYHYYHDLPPPIIQPSLTQQWKIPPPLLSPAIASVATAPLHQGPQIEYKVFRDDHVQTVVDSTTVPNHIAKVVTSFRLAGMGLHVRVFVSRKKTSGQFPYSLNPHKWCYCGVMENCDCSETAQVKKKVPVAQSLPKRRKEEEEGKATPLSMGHGITSPAISIPTQPAISKIQYKYDRTSLPPTVPFLHLSDPARLGVAWCWELRRPIIATMNWAWLVEFAECEKKDDQRSWYFQIALDNVICTTTGGMEIQHEPFDPSSPFKASCIKREMAITAEENSCWLMREMNRRSNHPQEPIFMKLERTSQDQCLGLSSPTRRIMASKFSIQNGGVNRLDHCNGGQYSHAIISLVPSIMEDTANPLELPPVELPGGQMKPSMLELQTCQPPNAIPQFACKGVGHQCFKTLPVATIQKHIR